MGDEALEVGCFGHGAIHGMIFRLSARIQDAALPVIFGGGQRHQTAQGFGGQVMGTGTGDEAGSNTESTGGNTG